MLISIIPYFLISGLGHAYENDEEYGDETSIMGFSSSDKEGPAKCFNGQNLFHFGWFESRSIGIDPFQQGHQIVELAAFVDFDETTDDQYVLVNVFDVYLVFNRAKDFNAGTTEYQDKVTITRDADEINSSLEATLDISNTIYTIDNFQNSGHTLFIKVCQIVIGDGPDHYVLSIGLDYTMCPSPTGIPLPVTNAPTLAPTARPTKAELSIPSQTILEDVFLSMPTPPTPPQDFLQNPERPYRPQIVIYEKDVTPRDPIYEVDVVPATRAPGIDDLINKSSSSSSSSLEDIQSHNIAVIFGMISFGIVLFCCIVCCAQCCLRRLEERRRNLLIFATEDIKSEEMKSYMKHPI